MTISSISSSYSQARMLEMRQKMFTSLDANGDGTVSKDELAQMVANGPKNGPSADQLLSQMDTDGNGSVSQSEFMAGPGGGQQAQADQSGSTTDDYFSSLDTNGDGYISKSEFEAAMGESTSSVQGGSQEQKLLDKLLEALGTAGQTTSSTASTTSTSSTASTTSQSGTSSTSLVEMLGAALASYMQLSSSSLSQTSVSSFFGSGLYV
jgi:Ca2+-binding EF-hand superfamily protein